MAVKKTTKKTVKKTSARKAPAKKNSAKKASSGASARTATKPKTSSNTFAQPFDFKNMEKIMNNQFQFDQFTQDAANQSRENVEAFVKSGEIFAKGFENIMKTAAAMTQTATEKQAEYAKQLMGSKTLNEFAETQNKIAQSSFDQFMQGATQLSEMSVKVISEASEPLNAQMSKAMQKAKAA